MYKHCTKPLQLCKSKKGYRDLCYYVSNDKKLSRSQ